MNRGRKNLEHIYGIPVIIGIALNGMGYTNMWLYCLNHARQRQSYSETLEGTYRCPNDE